MKPLFNDYYATEDGKIYSGKSNKYLSTRKSKRGYALVNLSIDGKCKTFSVHSLIAKAYIPNPDNLPEINHKDGNKENNNVSNLEWCTSSQNSVHALREGLMVPAKGLATKNGRFTDEDIITIRNLYNSKQYSQYKIAEMYNVTRSAIQQIIERKTYKHVE